MRLMRSSGERGVLVRRGLGFMMVRALSSVGYLVWGVIEVRRDIISIVKVVNLGQIFL